MKELAVRNSLQAAKIDQTQGKMDKQGALVYQIINLVDFVVVDNIKRHAKISNPNQWLQASLNVALALTKAQGSAQP